MNRGRLIGLDLGSKRVGVAVSDADRTVATGVQVLNRTGDRSADHQAVASLVAEFEAVGVIVGLPLTLSGAQGPASREILAEVEELRRSLAVEVQTVDERLTTVAASAAHHRKGRPVDDLAAALILQTWMDRERNSAD